MTTPPPSAATPLPWHRALALALVGEDRDDLDEPTRPDVKALVAALGGTQRIAAHAQEVRTAEQPWPHPLPETVTAGMGPAQLQALITRAVDLVRVAQRTTAPVINQRALSPDEIRLLRDVPPHHGV